MRTLPRVEDVAEALHLEVDDVQSLLAKVRAAPPAVKERPRSKAFAYLGWAVAAVVLAWFTLRPASPPAVVTAPSPAPKVPGMLPKRPPKTIAVFPMDLMPPSGYDVGVRVNGVVLSLAGRRDVRPGPVAKVRAQLADAVALLIQRAEEIGASEAFAPGQPIDVNAFTQEPSVWINGPAGTNVSFPIPTEMHTGPSSISTYKTRIPAIEAAIAGMFEGKRSGAESGTRGFVFPPSGFEVRFSGRRRAGSAGGPVALPGFDQADARDRLFRSMRSMMDADLKPVDGRWRQDRDKERSLKTPDLSHFRIETMGDTIEFDVPTKPGTRRQAQDAVLRAKAAEAVAAYVQGGAG